jgi:Uma2 family endonuclease
MNIAVSTRSTQSNLPMARPESIHRFTVDEYHRMIEVGLLLEGARIELLDGWIVDKMTTNPPHAFTMVRLYRLFSKVCPDDLVIRTQLPITLVRSEPEPDLSVAVGPDAHYRKRHPGPRDLHLVIEIADSSLLDDRRIKGRLYAESRIPQYWIVNIVNFRVEVYTQPRAGKKPSYRHCQEYGRDDRVPLIFDEKEIAQIPVRELLPV